MTAHTAGQSEITDIVDAARRIAHERVVRELADELTDRYRAAVARHLSRSPAGTPVPPAVEGANVASPVRPAREPDLDRAWYVYGIVRTADVQSLSLPAGIDEQPTTILRCGELAAVSAEVDLAGFRSVRQDAPDISEGAWLARAVRAHDRVVDETFGNTAVLPLRFGCLYPDRAALGKTLEGARCELLDELFRLDGAAEWTVSTTTAVLGGERGPEPSHDGAVDGTSWLRARRDQIRARSDRRRTGSRALRSALDEISEHARETVRAPSTRDGDGVGETLICLVDRTATPRLQDAVASARQRYAPAVQVTLRGPHPPYHFARLPEVATTRG